MGNILGLETAKYFNLFKLQNVNKILDKCESFENIKLQNLDENIFDGCQSYENCTKKQIDGCQSYKNRTKNKLLKVLYHKVRKKVIRNTKIKFL